MICNKPEQIIADFDPRAFETVQKLGLVDLVAEYQDILNKKDAERARVYFGCDDASTHYRIFHGTVPEKIEPIKSDGLRAFIERMYKDPRIYVTTSPAIALWHAHTNGPHDTQRNHTSPKETYSRDKPIVLVIKLPKNYVAEHPDGQIAAWPEWIAQDKKISTEENTRFKAFQRSLESSANNIGKGIGGDDFGIMLPIKHVPVEFIYVKTFSEDVPITKF